MNQALEEYYERMFGKVIGMMKVGMAGRQETPIS
jgi:hypothetical protein